MSAATRAKYRGAAFEFGDSHIIVPPITVDQTVELAEFLDKDVAVKQPAPDASADDQREFLRSLRGRNQARKKVISVAVKRNYPNMADSDISDFVNEENCPDLYFAAIGRSTKQKVKDPEELAPAATGQTLTGAASTGA